MGNQVNLTRSKSDVTSVGSPEVLLRRHDNKTSATDSTRTSSSRPHVTPSPQDLIGATPYPRTDARTVPDPKCVDLKVFRSFSALEDGGETRKTVVYYPREPVVNIRIYRRSGDMGKRSDGDGGFSDDGTMGGRGPPPRTMRRSRSNTGQQLRNGSTPRLDKLNSLVGSEPALDLTHTQVSSRAASVCPVVKRDFPDADKVHSRIAVFEHHFVSALLRRYNTLPSLMAQTSILSVAIHLRRAPHRHITLYRSVCFLFVKTIWISTHTHAHTHMHTHF